MVLTIAGTIAVIGILFGLNYTGLFVAAYVFDRTARHILWYLVASAFFLISGVAFFLSSATPYTKPFLVIDDIATGWGFIALSLGLANVFSIRLSKRVLAAVAASGAVLVIAASGYSEISVTRLALVSPWQGIMPAVTAMLILFTIPPSIKSRYLGSMMLAAAISVLARPLIAAYVQTIPERTYAERIEIYGAVVAVPLLIALFSIGAGAFFHVMSDLVKGYRNASITDSLTGLLNRRGFLDKGQQISAWPAALIMIDIDRFKSINDTLGHEAGDRVIAAVAELMIDAAPEPHLCGRLGGEEFAIVLNRAELEVAEAFAHSVRLRIEIELADLLPGRRQITASFGVAAFGAGGLNQALLRADHALYRAKDSGRNAVCVAQDDDAGTASRTGGRRGVGYSGTTMSVM